MHLPLPEAPHRGYHCAGALFGGVRAGDHLDVTLAARLVLLLDEHEPALVLAPQGLGGHVDHLQVVEAVLLACDPATVAWYRDTPYVIRDPAATPSPRLPTGLREQVVAIDAVLPAKLAASCYASQLGFQFGGGPAARAALTALATSEGRGAPAERLHSATAIANLFSIV